MPSDFEGAPRPRTSIEGALKHRPALATPGGSAAPSAPAVLHDNGRFPRMAREERAEDFDIEETNSKLGVLAVDLGLQSGFL